MSHSNANIQEENDTLLKSEAEEGTTNMTDLNDIVSQGEIGGSDNSLRVRTNSAVAYQLQNAPDLNDGDLEDSNQSIELQEVLIDKGTRTPEKRDSSQPRQKPIDKVI